MKVFEKDIPDVYTFIATAERNKGYEEQLVTHMQKYLKRKGYTEAVYH